MNVNETSYRNMSVSGVDDVIPSFNGRAQRKHESHDVHPLQWIDLNKKYSKPSCLLQIRTVFLDLFWIKHLKIHMWFGSVSSISTFAA